MKCQAPALGSTDQTKLNQNGAYYVLYHRTKLNRKQDGSTPQTRLDTRKFGFVSSYKETPPAFDSQQRPVAAWPVFSILLYSHRSASVPPLFFRQPEGFSVGSYRNRNLQNVTEGSHLDLQLSLLPFWPSTIIKSLSSTEFYFHMRSKLARHHTYIS